MGSGGRKRAAAERWAVVVGRERRRRVAGCRMRAAAAGHERQWATAERTVTTGIEDAKTNPACASPETSKAGFIRWCVAHFKF